MPPPLPPPTTPTPNPPPPLNEDEEKEVKPPPPIGPKGVKPAIRKDQIIDGPSDAHARLKVIFHQSVFVDQPS